MSGFKDYLSSLPKIDKIIHQPMTEKSKLFEQLYIKVRRKENRIFSDEEVALLPFLTRDSEFYREWVIRQITLRILIKQLYNKKNFNVVLDLGCGNGWLLNFLTNQFNFYAVGIDINLVEIQQGRRVFNKNSNIEFLVGDFVLTDFPKNSIDAVIVNGVLQYFSDPVNIIKKILNSLTNNGHIFILDTMFYKKNKLFQAKMRTNNYFSNLGFPEMSNYYFHHTLNIFESFKTEIVYNPKTIWKTVFRSIFTEKFSPFYVIKIAKS